MGNCDRAMSGLLRWIIVLALAASPRPRIEQVQEPPTDPGAAPVSESITVTAVRAPLASSETPSSVVVIGRDSIDATAALATDDALRQAAGFSLFRRSGSRTANPTTQGVSLRGTGASGASRASVLSDGIPLNDPFGGWVWWGRVPLAAVEQAEIVRGGASELYGSPALGGVIQLLRRTAADTPRIAVDVSWGSLDSRNASLIASVAGNRVSAVLSGEAYASSGYIAIAPEERGPVDAETSSRHETAELTLDRRTESTRSFLRGSYYEESRQNGTRLQTNDVHIAEASAGWELASAASSTSVRAWANDERFHQGFSSITPDRSAERLTRYQSLPVDAEGVSGQATRLIGRNLFVAGLETRRVGGETRELVPGASTSFELAGGREETGAAFIEDVVEAGGRWTAVAGVRFDAWRETDGHRRVESATGAITSESRYPDRSETATSPRLSLMFRAGPDVSLAASAYRSFRAPTLNELYRSFRVGNVAKAANPALAPERATGAETSFILSSRGAASFSARASLFWMQIDDAIGNRTLSSTPTVINRRRENLGGLRSRGAEVDAAWRLPADGWSLRGGYLFSDSIVLSAPAAPALVGRRTPQVPRHQATFQIERRSDRILAAVQARGATRQFDDDENRLPLASYWTADLFFSVNASRRLRPYASVENVFDRRVEIGRTPATTLGAPRVARIGLRVDLPR